MNALTGDDRGKYVVRTASSTYEVDTAEGRLRRWPSEESSNLRVDEEWIELLRIERCEVGSPALFWVHLPEADFATMRITTEVRQVEEVSQ